jgi:hypothetical protein
VSIITDSWKRPILRGFGSGYERNLRERADDT